MHESVLITKSNSRTYSTAKLIPMPRIIPAIPPRTVMLADSIRNCRRILLGLAPSAFLIPISCLRSVTVTIIMFMIPMPPTKREIAAIAARSMDTVAVISLI